MQSSVYKAINAISQSGLTLLYQGPKYFHARAKKPDEERQIFNRNFDIGDYVDLKLTGGDVSIYTGLTKPFPNVGTNPHKVIKYIVETNGFALLPHPCPTDKLEELVLETATTLKIGGSTWKPEKIKSSLEEAHVFQIIKELSAAYHTNREVIGKNDLRLAQECAMAVENDPIVSQWFKQQPDEELHFQHILHWRYRDVECKGLPDVIRINHKNKLIRPGDLKTTEYKNISAFATADNFERYRLDLQADFYTIGLMEDPYIKDLLSQGYKIDNEFTFLVVSKTSLMTAQVSYIRDTSLDNLEEGMLYNGKRLKGVRQLIEDYKFHTETNQWDHPAEFYKTNSYIVGF